MSSWTIIGLAVAGAVALLAAAVIAVGARRRNRFAPRIPAGTGTGAPEFGRGAPAITRTETAITRRETAITRRETAITRRETAITRRELVNRGIIGAFVAALSGVVASAVAYVWSDLSSSHHRYAVGGLGDVRQRLAVDRHPYVGGNGRFYLVPFPSERLAEAAETYPPEVLAGMRQGLVALSPICTHQACHVPYCASSAWFECPCHGARFDRIGELRRGPAPRGLDHYELSVVAGLVTVDTSRTYLGPPPGTETLDDPPAGPHCF